MDTLLNTALFVRIKSIVCDTCLLDSVSGSRFCVNSDFVEPVILETLTFPHHKMRHFDSKVKSVSETEITHTQSLVPW